MRIYKQNRQGNPAVVFDLLILLRRDHVCDLHVFHLSRVCLNASNGVLDDARRNCEERIILTFADIESRANG